MPKTARTSKFSIIHGLRIRQPHGGTRFGDWAAAAECGLRSLQESHAAGPWFFWKCRPDPGAIRCRSAFTSFASKNTATLAPSRLFTKISPVTMARLMQE
jgi:hypothetical protein